MHTFKPSPALLGNVLQSMLKRTILISVSLILIFCNFVQAQSTNCAGATSITPVNASTCTPGTSFNISGTGTGGSFSSCTTGGGNYNWGKFTAVSSTASISYTPASNRDAIVFAYSGSCGSLTQLGCKNDFGNGGTETLDLSGLTPGNTYYIAIVRNASTGNMTGTICVASPNVITTGTISGSPFCGGATISVPFTSYGTYSGNTYTAQLSNSSGSFASPTSIGTLTSNSNSGSISSTLPATASGTGYRIRVVSSGPAVTGSDNGSNLTINPQPQGELSGNTICGTGSPELTFTASSGTGPFTVVYNDGLFNRTKTNVTSGVGFAPAIIPIVTSNYTLVSVTDNNGCARTSGFTDGTATILFGSVPTMVSSSTANAICTSASSQNSSLSYTLTTGAPTNYTIQWDAAALSAGLVNLGSTAITASPLNIPVAANVAAGTYNGTVTLTNVYGCSSSGNAFTLTINPTPTISGTLTVCTGATTQLTGSGTPAIISPWVSATTSVATVNSTGLVTGISAGTSVITYTNIYGCANTATISVSTSPSAVILNPASATTCNSAIRTLAASNYINTSPQTNSSGAISVSIPDNSATGASSTISVSGIPADAVVTGVSVNFNITHTYDGDLILNLRAPNGNILNLVNRRGGSANNFTNTIISSAGSVAVSSGSAPFTGTYLPDAASGVGPTSNVSNVTTFSSLYGTANGNWVFSARDASNSDNGTITSWSVTITYTLPTVTWSTNTTDLYTDAGATVSYIAQNTATVYAKPSSTQTYTAIATAANGCTTSNSVTVTVTAAPTITASSAAATVCFSTSSQNSTLSYSATTGSPTQYSITWNSAALTAGLINLGNTAITSSPLNIPVAANVAAGTYTGTIAVANATCTGPGSTFTLTISGTTITASSAASARCFSSGAQTGSLAYSATTGSPTNYTITWDAAAQTAGFVNLGSTALGSSPVSFPIAAGIVAGTYNGTLNVINSDGCISAGAAFTQTISPIPSITNASAAATRCYSASAQTSTLTYSATSGSPTQYSITWDAAALTAGFTNVTVASLPVSPISIPVPAGVAVGTYSGSINVYNAIGCHPASGNSFTITISGAANPTMTSASSATICSGSAVNIPLTADIPSTFTWIAASNSNVTGESTTLQTTSTLNNTLTLSVSSAQTVSYTVIPTSTSDGCVGASQNVSVTVNMLPTITASATAAARCYSSSAQTSTLSYSATTGSPDLYNITWNAAALSAGLSNTGNVSLPASPISFSIPAGVAVGTYTGTLYVSKTGGCTSSGTSFTLTINALPTITSQPSSTTVCSGSNTSFSISATGTGLTYQWRRGTTNLCNCGNVSGVTSATLTITSATITNAATDYNCVVTGGGCSSIISNYATLTVTTTNTAPTTNPKDLVFPTVSVTSILASFTAASDATNYLVIRKTTNVAPTNPSNGTTYTVGSTTLTGVVDYVGTSITFTSNGLAPGTTYYYWIFPYNTSTCGTSPLYLTSSPLTGSATTATNITCGTVTTLYWGGKGSALSGATSGTDFNTASNWSTSNSSYVASPAAPTECNDVSMAITSSSTITLSGTTSIYGLNFTVSGSGRKAILSTNGNTLTVNSDAIIDVTSGDSTTNIYVGEYSSGAGIVDFKANFKLGETYYANVWPNYSAAIPRSYLIGNINSKITFRGDVLFGRTARFVLPGNVSYPPSYPLSAPGTATTPGTILFDGPGLQQVLWNNNVWYDCFYNIVVGDQNKPYVRHVTGTYTPDNILNDFTINSGCTVDLGTSQWIRENGSGGTFTMNGDAKLILGNYRSVKSNCGTGCSTGVPITGSNFPGGFATMDISSSSTIEYNGGNSITQTVYATPTYGNLILSNSDGTGTANKISTGTVTVSGTATISNKTTFTPGTDVVINGTAYINSGGTWTCGTNVVSGGGTFDLQSGGNITMASAAGITSSGATGNIQTGARIFSTGGNYTYNGSSAQATGDGLPRTVNNLTISNTSGVTMYAASANYTVAGTLALTSGALSINGDSLTINALTRTSGTLTGSSSSSVGITGTGVPLFFTSGGRTLKNLFLNTSASADLQTTLDITAGSSAGSVAVGSGATLNTFGNLTLKSDANGTARVSEIPVDGSGNALGNINGNVVIERYIPGRRSWRMVTAPVQASGSQTINAAWQEGVVNADLSTNQNPSPGFGVHISGASTSLGFDATPLNNPSLKIFNRSTSSWSGIPNTLSTYVRDYEGYMIFVRGNRSTLLSLNNYAPLSNTVIRETGGIRMGRQSVVLPSSTGSYSVVGNPYPSTIDFRTLSISGSGSTKTFVMWDPALTGTAGVGAYQYFTQSGGAGTDYTVFPGGGSYGSAGTVNNFVQSGQAFLVTNNGAATLVINENSKASSSNSAVFRPMPDNITGKISTILYGFEADSSTTVLDGAMVMYRNEYTDVLDLDDVKKINNTNSENFGMSIGSTVYQIELRQSINETDTIHYSMRNLRARKYRLAVDLKNIETAGITAYLKDNYTNTVTTLDFNNSNVLEFTPVASIPASYAPDRFKIYFKEMNVLPVTFTSLEAYRKNNQVNVDWKVQNETNIHHYEVERSADGVTFSKIGTNVPANHGNIYNAVDEQPLYGLNYFRVKAVENNSRIKYTNVAKLFFGKNAAGITVFPNPVSEGKINIYIAGEQKGEFHANLFNTSGQLLQTINLGQLSGNGNTAIEMNKELPHGNYILEIVKPDLSKEHINIVY